MSAAKGYCPLCRSSNTGDFFEDRARAYQRCGKCRLVFVPGEFHVSLERERARYDLHENGPGDDGYRDFLKRIIGPLKKKYPAPADCLEFGCGPSPVLAQMLTEEGFNVTAYDPFYRPDVPSDGSFDIITATEVFEHLREPGTEIEGLASRLRPGGILAVMTKILESEAGFAGWHYKNDITHICFYTWETFEWIARRFGWRASRIDKDIVFLEN